MSEQLNSPIENHSAPLEQVQGLGHLVLNRVLQPEADIMFGTESMQTIAETANYPGNWMQAQQTRMANPDFKSKYENMVNDSMPDLKEGSLGMLDKPEHFQAYHRELADSFGQRSEHVYSAVEHVPAVTYGLTPRQTGRGGIGEQGTVFTDASTKEGTPLNDRQKDIIAAHEAYHGMIKAPSPVYAELSQAFDKDVYYNDIVDGEGLSRPSYLQNPDELMARMAQLKNYFGMQGGEEFTDAHLEYARTHYVEDTGLDNSMSIMFRIISSRTESHFLHAMNTLPV